mmetsp:Transcript_79316/g.161297  ORF Transcript_79316/g.161297 Transcript_79316/m.161297 type:complete len:445 (+) Transcript_79316:24-1358(+)
MAEDDALTPQGLMRWIVCSLYVDEAIPRGGVLQWYWQLLTGVKLTQQQLVSLIDSTPGVYLDPPGCKRMNFRAVLEEPPQNFRGFIQEQEEGNPKDLVTPEVWEDIRGLLAQGGWPKITDPGYRNVSLAAWLQDQTEGLSGVTFGRLLQVTIVGSHNAKLLGLREGALVPYAESEEYERFANAEAGKPTGVKSNESYIKNWDDLYDSLRKLINDSPKYEIEISQLKLQCRAKLRKELSETVFGHFSLSRLLEDPRISEYIERSGDPITRPCITMRRSAKWGDEGKGKSSGSEMDDPWADPAKDPWASKGKGKETSKGKILVKGTPQKGLGKGSKAAETPAKAKAAAKGAAKPAVKPATKPAAKAVAKPGSEELVEAEILLADDKKATLKVSSTEELADAVERFCKENGLEEQQSKLLSWLEKQVVDPKGSSTLKVDIKTIASGN